MEDVPSPSEPPGEPAEPRAGPSDPAAGPSDRPDGSLLGAGAVAFLTLGVAVAVSLALGAAIGYLLDAWAGTSPLFTLLGLAFGLVIATLMTISRVRKYL